MDRTDAQIYSRTAKLRLGGKEYAIKVLPIKPAEQWLGRFWEWFGSLSTMQAAVASGDLDGMHKVYDLIFEYAPDLPREEIEERADPSEMFDAFHTVYRLANPLLSLARTVLGVGEYDARR